MSAYCQDSCIYVMLGRECNPIYMSQVLEKLRPLDQKLKYQIDKLVKTAVTGSLSKWGKLLSCVGTIIKFQIL